MPGWQQAFREYPWLRQRRWWGTAVLILVLLGVLTVVDLHLSSRQIVAAREATNMMAEMVNLEVETAALRSAMAARTSWRQVAHQAREMGLGPVTPGEIRYIPLPGGLPGNASSSTQGLGAPRRQVIRPEYQISLQEWLLDLLFYGGQE